MKTQKPDIIVIVSDSLRQDHVSHYTGKASPIKTPHIDALLRDSVAFDNMYPEGLSTIPVRTEWMTGIGTLAGQISSAIGSRQHGDHPPSHNFRFPLGS